MFLEGLNSPFGMALVGNDLYVANTDAVVRFPYRDGRDARSPRAGAKVADLPGGPLNHHWTKNLIASRDGTKLYATVGSNSNVAENGMDEEEGRAAIWEIDLRRPAQQRIFASGLRNPNGLALGAADRRAVDRGERARRARQRPRARLPDLGAGRRLLRLAVQLLRRSTSTSACSRRGPTWSPRRSSPTTRSAPTWRRSGLAFADGSAARAFASGAFIGQHGSWNRKPRSGYNVVFVPVRATASRRARRSTC